MYHAQDRMVEWCYIPNVYCTMSVFCMWCVAPPTVAIHAQPHLLTFRVYWWRAL